MYLLTNGIHDKNDAWVVGICIGIILICGIFLVIQALRIIHYENELDRRIRRRDKVNKITRRK